MNLAEHVLRNRFRGRIALIGGGEQVSWDALADRVARVAGALRSHGVRPGEQVLFVMRDTPAFAAAWLGAVHAGAIAVALNSKLADADYRHILVDSRAKLAMVDEQFTAARDVFGKICVELEPGSPVPPFDAEPDAPALCLYSSGTTGRPKGILHAHRAALSIGEAFRALGIGEGDRVFTTSKFFFAYGLEHALLAPLAMGVTSILSADWPDADAVLGIVERHRPKAIFSVPTIYRRLLAEPARRLEPLREVRHFVAGGERLSPQLVQQWRSAAGGELLNLYGMSEGFCACMMTPPGTSDGLRTGKPFPIAEVRLADGDGAEPAPGEPGVLWLRHPAQARGYANLPEQTRSQFRDGWFCSRDLFMRDAQGFYIHQGRTDELVKVAGQWVWPSELEEAALAAAAVADAACVPVPDGEGLQRLALFVTARNDEDPTRAAADACERLPRYKRPKWIRAVPELPRTASGKVQRYKLREILERELGRSG
ncbi:MAG TPA: AMP-binding protein [Burkholderiales bacterium]|jgi:benzoate-CoA ligase